MASPISLTSPNATKFHCGRPVTPSVDQLIEIIGVLLRKLEAAGRRIEELEAKLGKLTSKLDEPFSVAAEEKRQVARGKTPRKKNKPLRRGRISTAEKLAKAQREEEVFPEGLDPADCWFSHSRPVWRLDQGQAVLVAYHIYRGTKNRYGQIPGVIGRSEFGLEIVLAVAYPVYGVARISWTAVAAELSVRLEDHHYRRPRSGARHDVHVAALVYSSFFADNALDASG